MRDFSFQNSESPVPDAISRLGGGIEDVQGFIRDALTHEEKAAEYLKKIEDTLQGVLGSIDRVSGGAEDISNKLGDSFLEQLDMKSSQEGGGISKLLGEVEETKSVLQSAIGQLNGQGGFVESMGEAFEENPAFAILGASITAMAGLLGAVGGAAAGPVGAVAGGAAGAAAGASLTSELVADHFSDQAALISAINNLADDLASFSDAIEQAASFIQPQISKLEEEQPEEQLEV